MKDQPASQPQAPPDPHRVELVGIALAALPVSVAKPIRVEPPTSDQWTALTVQVGATVLQVIGEQRRRARAMLRNLDDTASITLAVGRDDNRGTGYVLAPGAEIELRHTQSVHASSPNAGGALLTVLVEHNR